MIDNRGFPWQDVDASRQNRQLQENHPIGEGRQRYGHEAKPCPVCQTLPMELAWFYFESPQWTWGEALCGRAGWLSVCDKCRLQVDFFLEVMN